MIIQKSINRLLDTCPDEEITDFVKDLWKCLAVEIISIVGQDGYDALYARAQFLAKRSSAESRKGGGLGIENLLPDAVSESANTASQFRETNRQLLIIFKELLSTLIGEQLTTRLLEVAWKNLMNHRVKG